MKRITLPYNYQPRGYQMPFWHYMDGRQKHKRAVLVRHRRAGKDTDCINLCMKKAYEKVGIYAHIFPTSVQGRSVIWQGRTNDGKAFRDYFPEELIGSLHENEMRVSFENGSIYRVLGSDNPDALRGMNIQGAILSEYQDHDPAVWQRIVEPMLLANGGWAAFAFTPKGKNHGYRIVERAKREGWFHEVLTINDTKDEAGQPIIDAAYIEKLRQDGMDEAIIQAEYYCSFDSSVLGAFYGKQMDMARADGRVCDIPVESSLPVSTAWDLGWGDKTSIWFIQPYGPFEYRVIDYFEAHNEPLPYYVRILQEKQAKYNLTYEHHYFPHDINVHDLSTGRKRIDTLRELGMRPTVVEKHAVDDGIDQVRMLIPKCWFDAKRCERGINALTEYKREWDDKLQAFRPNPLHNYASHASDAFRTFAMGHRRRSKYAGGKPQQVAVTEYDDI